mgnify:CR=1 FL=1
MRSPVSHHKVVDQYRYNNEKSHASNDTTHDSAHWYTGWLWFVSGLAVELEGEGSRAVDNVLWLTGITTGIYERDAGETAIAQRGIRDQVHAWGISVRERVDLHFQLVVNQL